MAFGFGVVGCGMISRFHARAVAELRNARLVACCSANPESALRFAEEHSCTAYEDLPAMLADPAVDVVSICSPSGAHMEAALAAARAGKHVIVEKPLEVTVARCDRIIRECEKHGVSLATIFPSRFHESSRLLKKAVDQGRFGKVTLGDAYVKWFRTQKYYDSGAWRGTWKLDGGGALMNQAIHSVDLLVWLMGPVESVAAHTAMLAHERIEVEDVAVASLRFASGALGTIEASTAAYPGYLKRIEISGSHGTAVLEEEDIKVWDFARTLKSDTALRERMAGKTKTGGGAADPAAIGHHAHAAQFKDFLQAIQKGTTPSIDGHEGRRSVEVIEAIYKSAKTGKAVRIG
jgi:UDP-N-acetyl-2-amino-2-deoxyglucuronate dehydrogenase